MTEAKARAEEAKAYLLQIRKYDKQINRKIAHKEALYNQITRTTPVLRQDAATGGGNQDKIGSALAKMIDLEREITQDIDNLADLKRQAEKLLDRVADKNADHFEVLSRRYISYESYPKIAFAMGYESDRGAKSLHGRALLTFWKVMHEKKEG